MASVDLYGGDAGTIRNAYKTHLGRDAGDNEVEGWLSGSYGGGGLNDWVTQISQSDEARRRTPAKTPTTDTQTTTPPVVGQPPPGVSGPQQGQPNGAAAVQAPWDPNVWNQAAGKVTSAYQQYLGRGAQDDEVTNWLTGKYGYGSGPGGLDAILAAIKNSGEAKAYGGTQAPQYKDLAYWQSQGVSENDIFDRNTGQTRQGWQRTGNGYERTGGQTTTTTGGTPPGGYQAYVQSLFAGKAPNPKTLESMAGELAKYGIKLGPRNARGFIDTIILPDGTEWDLIQSATADGGAGWQWIRAGGSSGGGSGPSMTTPGLPNVYTPGSQFSDPYSVLLEQLLSGRINELLQPVNDPSRQQYANAMQARANALGGAEKEYTQLLDFLQKRFTELQQPAYTGAENEVLRTQALDPIERDRAAAKQRVMERLSARGLNLESGIAQQALNAVDAEFDSMRGQNQTALATNELARREDRSQRAATIGGQLVDIPQARQREQLDVFSALNDLSGSVRNEEEARRREAIGYGGALADLPVQRLQLAMQAAGMGGTPASALQSLLSVANMNQANSQYQNSRSASVWSGLGSIAAILANAGRR